MENEKKILVNLIQAQLAGKIDPSSNFNPQSFADAIITKLDLNRTLEERNAKNVDEAIQSFTKMIEDIDNDMDTELEQLGKDEVLVKNFVRGQKTVCAKLKDEIKKV